MSNDNLDYYAEHYCPVYKRVITADLCYDSLMCLNGCFKISSTKELRELMDIESIESARDACGNCKYSEL